ncbi:hypothetical protein [Nocardia altamirensis]|uniref:hypothetical protein n=1 Tax=Nocardia TaxID=1817 RepID=UPI0014355CA8|nr:hypothetical protein [Nocardia altamirensis]
MTFAFPRELPLWPGLVYSARRTMARYRLTPDERRNLVAARAARAAIFTASMGGHSYYR